MLLIIASFGSVMLKIWYVILAFLILMLMVTVHEFGHYLAGKLLKFKINEFAVGMGPKLLSKTRKNGEVISLRAFPLGGYCAFEGENDDGTDNPDAFNKQKPWKRLIVLFAGAFFNFLFAVLVCFILFTAYGESVTVVGKPFGYADSAVQELQTGDIIYEVNGKRVYLIQSVSEYLKDDQLEVTVYRQDGTFKTIKVDKQTFFLSYVSDLKRDYTLDDNGTLLTKGDQIYKIDDVYMSKNGQYGQYLSDLAVTYGSDHVCQVTILTQNNVQCVIPLTVDDLLLKIGVKESPYSGLGISTKTMMYKYPFGMRMGRILPFCGETAVVVLKTLGGLFTGSTGLDEMGGPITTIAVTSQVVAAGFPAVLLLIVLISVNLAVFNLLPVPALDGCQMVFVIIEWITKKPLKPKVQAMINGIGLIILIALVILLDVLKVLLSNSQTVM